MFGSLERLREAVEAVEIAPVADDLAAALATLDTLRAKVSAALGAFDAEGGFVADGAVSTTAWLKHHGLTRREAAALARDAKALHVLPATRDAWCDGVLSGGQVQAVLANVAGKVEAFAAMEADLVPTLAPLSVRDVGNAMRHWRVLADQADAAPAPPKPAEVYLSPGYDGRWELAGSFDTEPGEVVSLALRLAETPDAAGERRSAAARRADALVEICRFFCDRSRDPGAGQRNRPNVTVTIDVSTLAEASGGWLATGQYLDVATMRRLLCDAGVHRCLTDGPSAIIDYGRTRRLASPAQFRALVVADGGCRHPGCDRPPEWCEAHHVVPWEDGGPTDLSNLVLKCSRHHHLGHQPGWAEKLKPDRTLEITDPSGRVFTSHPPRVLRS